MSSSRKTNAVSVALACALLSAVEFLPSLSFRFVNWDDNVYVYANPHLKTLGPDFISWAFSTGYVAYWQPNLWLSFGLDYTLWGLEPMGYHLTNILLHSLNVFLATMLAFRLFEVMWPGGSGVLFGAAVAGLTFGIHPTKVPSVAWVAERKDLLFALFYLAGLYAWLNFASSGSRRKRLMYALSLGFFTLSLMSKPMALSFPAAMLVMDFFPLKRLADRAAIFRVMVLEKAPFILFTAVYTWGQLSLAKSSGVLSGRFGSGQRILLSLKGLFFYFYELVFPLQLSPYYPLPERVSLFSGEYILLVALVPVTLLVLSMTRAKNDGVVAALAFYAAALVPALGIVQHGSTLFYVNYVYLPMLGPSLLLGGCAKYLWGGPGDLRLRKGLLLAASLSLLVSCSALTQRFMQAYGNAVSLWSYAEKRFPSSVTILSNLSEAHLESGDRAEAINWMGKAISYHPGEAWLHFKRGMYYYDGAEYARAIKDISMATALMEARPLDNASRAKLAEYYTNLGAAHARLGDYGFARRKFSRAIELDKSAPTPYYNRALSSEAVGEIEQAIEDYREAARLGDDRARSLLLSRGIEQ